MRGYCLWVGLDEVGDPPAVSWVGEASRARYGRPRRLVKGATEADVLGWLAQNGVALQPVDWSRREFALTPEQEFEFRTRWF